jgi:predicted DNA-binding transcriptional regulator AlpA
VSASPSSSPDVSAINLRLEGRLRTAEVVALLKISESWFWKGVASGLYPKPDYYVGKFPFWKHATILKVIEHGEVASK